MSLLIVRVVADVLSMSVGPVVAAARIAALSAIATIFVRRPVASVAPGLPNGPLLAVELTPISTTPAVIRVGPVYVLAPANSSVPLPALVSGTGVVLLITASILKPAATFGTTVSVI